MNGDLPVNNDLNNNQTQTPSDFDQRINGNIPNKKPGMKKGLIIFIIIILIAGLGVGAYFMFFNKPSTSQNNATGTNNSSTNNTVASSIKPAEVTLAVQDHIKTKYTQVMSEGTKLTGEQISFKSYDRAPYWNIDGVKFYVNYIADGASSLDINFNSGPGDIATITARYKGIGSTAIESLTSQGFAVSNDNIYGIKGSSSLAYIKDDVVCVIGDPNADTLSSPVSLLCGQLSKYTKDMASYKEIEPFTTAYAKTKTINDGTIFNFQELKVNYLGYRNAVVALGGINGVGGVAGLFYKTPTGDWTYFKSTQSVLPCTDYNTADLQAAFSSEPCYDSSKTGNASDTIVSNYYL